MSDLPPHLPRKLGRRQPLQLRTKGRWGDSPPDRSSCLRSRKTAPTASTGRDVRSGADPPPDRALGLRSRRITVPRRRPGGRNSPPDRSFGPHTLVGTMPKLTTTEASGPLQTLEGEVPLGEAVKASPDEVQRQNTLTFQLHALLPRTPGFHHGPIISACFLGDRPARSRRLHRTARLPHLGPLRWRRPHWTALLPLGPLRWDAQQRIAAFHRSYDNRLNGHHIPIELVRRLPPREAIRTASRRTVLPPLQARTTTRGPRGLGGGRLGENRRRRGKEEVCRGADGGRRARSRRRREDEGRGGAGKRR
jgi:hypothetical protein